MEFSAAKATVTVDGDIAKDIMTGMAIRGRRTYDDEEMNACGI